MNAPANIISFAEAKIARELFGSAAVDLAPAFAGKLTQGVLQFLDDVNEARTKLLALLTDDGAKPEGLDPDLWDDFRDMLWDETRELTRALRDLQATVERARKA